MKKIYTKPQIGIYNICSTTSMLTITSNNAGLIDVGGGDGTGESAPAVREEQDFSIWD